MPGTVAFEARTVPDGTKYSQELVFRNAPGLLQWGDEKNAFDSDTILGEVRGQVGGLVGIGILQDSKEKITAHLSTGRGPPSQPWLMLLPDLREVQWRFF